MSNALEIHKSLKSLIETKNEALPKDFNKSRFIQNCMAVIQENNKIASCEPLSVARTMLKGAFLGLDFYNKECYAIPYGNQLQFQTDYKGEKKLAEKYSVNPVSEIFAKLVRKDDFFEEAVIDSKRVVNFKPIPFSNKELIGAFAIANFKDGSTMTEVMSIQDIHNLRDKHSKSKHIWRDHEGEMAKKTVLRRLLKMIPLDFDSLEQNQTFMESSDFEFKKESSEEFQAPKKKMKDITPKEEVYPEIPMQEPFTEEVA